MTPGKHIVLIIRGNYEHGAGLNLREDGECSWLDSESDGEFVCDPHQIPDMERWLCAHVIDGDVGQAMPHPCSSMYVGGSRSRFRARVKNGDAKSSGGGGDATETKRR